MAFPKFAQRRASRSDQPKAEVQPLAWSTSEGFQILQAKAPVIGKLAGTEMIQDLASLMVSGHFGQGRRGVAVCAATEGTGVSFVATNLAAAIAASGVNTVLVEANLRTPKLSEVIRPPIATPGLASLLRDPALALEDVVSGEVAPNLRLVYAGDVQAHDTDLIATTRFRDFMSSCLRGYACTVVDTPAANRSPDARSIAATIGYALIVARRRRSFIEDVEMLSAQLAEDGVVTIGAILNGS